MKKFVLNNVILNLMIIDLIEIKKKDKKVIVPFPVLFLSYQQYSKAHPPFFVLQ